MDGDSVSFKCERCGKELDEAPPELADGEPCECGVEAASEDEPVLAHENVAGTCTVCGKDLVGEACERDDCPSVAAQAIRKDAVDTPFKVGI